MAKHKFLLVGWAGILLCPGAALAQDSLESGSPNGLQTGLGNGRQSGLQMDVSAGGSFERNPFLLVGDNAESAAAFVQLDPSYRSTSGVSSVTIGASLRAEEYFQRYDTNLSAHLGLDASRRVSPNTALRVRVSGHTSRSSAQDILAGVGSLTPAIPVPILLPDATFAGTSLRTTRLEVGLGLDHDFSSRDKISADLAAGINYFSGNSQSDFRFGSASFDYRRKLSERTTVMVSLGVEVFDYLKRTADDGVTFTPTAGITTELGPNLTVDASVGASLSRVKRLDGSNFSQVAPAMRAKLCYSVSSSSTCLSAARESQPTALNGLSNVTNVGVSTFQRIGSKDVFSANVGYTHTDRRPGIALAGPGTDLLSAIATYNHDFGKRFAGFISPSYSRFFRSDAQGRSNPGVRIGLRYRFGGAG